MARYVHAYCIERFVKYATDIMGVILGATYEETARRGIEAMEDFFRSIGMLVNLKELGVEPAEDQIQALADGCWRASGCSKLGAVKPLDNEDKTNIYRLAR